MGALVRGKGAVWEIDFIALFISFNSLHSQCTISIDFRPVVLHLLFVHHSLSDFEMRRNLTLSTSIIPSLFGARAQCVTYPATSKRPQG
ncbi:hypothetical protein QQF64_029677 [Cirrhinus molitorella]|uniref:Secreted protein n=1 Tax=Cirrhinus molitorella TaxID=172907 RepID=A0ABR3N1H3_9TELE